MLYYQYRLLFRGHNKSLRRDKKSLRENNKPVGEGNKPFREDTKWHQHVYKQKTNTKESRSSETTHTERHVTVQ